jgi:hypothetical protein
MDKPDTPATRDRRSAAKIATLVALPLTAALVLVPLWLGGSGDPEPPPPAPQVALSAVTVEPPPARDAAGQKACQELIAALPTQLGDRPARPVDSPSPYVVAWGEPVVVLRCGVDRPPAFLATAEVQDINGVSWFAERRGGTTAWTVVDRPVYVEVLAPVQDASASVARLSTAVSRALPKQPLDPVDN